MSRPRPTTRARGRDRRRDCSPGRRFGGALPVARRVTAVAAVAVLSATLTGAGVGASAATSTPSPTGSASPSASPSSSSSPGADPTGEPDAGGTETEETPLSVELTSISPPQIPRAGAITLSGQVVNDSSETWTDVNLAPIVSASPITTRDELATAAATAPDVSVGERLTDPGTNASLGDLAPGDSAPFSLRVPRAVLGRVISGDTGVYWVGVHALGTNADGRDLVADGRARTFLPLVSRAAARRTTSVSVVLPLRERARRAEDGSLNGPRRWAGLTSSRGRLTRLADFGASAGGAPVSWLVDPAVLDALEDFGRGNPPLSLGTARRVDPQDDDADDPQDDPSSTPSTSEEQASSPSPSPSATAGGTGSPSADQRAGANRVLQTFLGAAQGRDLLRLGYSDPDVAALTRTARPLLRRANALSARRLAARDLSGRPAVAPPEGFFDPDLLEDVSPSTVMVLTDQGRLTRPVLSTLPSGQELLLGDERAAAGGPSPAEALDPLALRQRILSESALEVSRGAGSPRSVVVVLPPTWDPGASWRQADFFGGLGEVPWLRLSPLPRNPTTTYAGTLGYTRAQRGEEIGPGNIAATRALTRTSSVMTHLLANSNDVDQRLTGAALQASAYSARPTRRLAADLALALDATARNKMDRVQVTGTDFVTLSGGSGSLTVTLVNGLQQPITVGLRARADDPDVKVEVPDPVEMQAGQRTTLRLQVSSSVGVHDVTLSPVTTEGEETGTPLTFSLRTSQVGRLIWYIIVAGGVLLAVMIGRRILQRVRSHRWRQEAGT